MPHQCVRCNTFYEDGAVEILKGCQCGARLFFFIKKEKLEEAKNTPVELDTAAKKELEKDVFNIMGIKDVDTPVVLDLESVKVLMPGKYELDLVRLFKDEPLIFKLADGKYVIDIAETFEKMRKKR